MIEQWAIQWGVSLEAVRDLQRRMGAVDTDPLPGAGGTSEAAVSNRLRIAVSQAGHRVFRNNVGALLDDRGVPVRYGLANDSRQMNERIKSADLIGWRRLLILPQHVGQHVAQFYSLEAKEVGWTYSATKHEQAQLAWAQLVNGAGGYARFSTSEHDL
ncbi:MAG: hypothetical protein EOO54_03790 [Haliea sp.]|nr:MAG: hypothetical protein EOO54_03790 [Haliea sp.]